MMAIEACGSRSPERRRFLVKRSALEEEEAAEITKQSASLMKLRELKEKMLKEMQDQEKQKASSAEGQVVPLSLAGEYKGGKDRELARWKPRPNSADRPGVEDLLSKYKEKLKDIMRTSAGQMARKEFDAIEKERRELEMENQRLRDVINLRHECSLRREEKCQREIQDLKLRLDGVALSGLDADTVMARLRAVNSDIQAEVHQLKGIIESQAEVEKMNLVRAYRVKMHEVKKQLADEKELNYTGAQEWIEKHKLLQHDFDAASAELNQIKEKNRLLIAENRNLKVAFHNQERQRTTMVKSIAAIKRENERLEEQISKLEFQILQVAKNRGGDDGVLLLQAAASAVNDAGGLTAEKRLRYVQSIDKMKVILEQDRKNLKQARSEHMTMLAERTELEIFLRQCIDDVRREIGRHSRMMATRPVSQLSTREGDFSLHQYTANDRKRIMDILLSKERVLLLLYDKTFPYKKDPLERDREAEPGDSAALSLAMKSTVPSNVEELWDKWKSWTSHSANPPDLL